MSEHEREKFIKEVKEALRKLHLQRVESIERRAPVLTPKDLAGRGPGGGSYRSTYWSAWR